MLPGETELQEILLPQEAADGVAAVLNRLGRTEDVRFAPDGKRLVIPEYENNIVHLFGFELGSGPNGSIRFDRVLSMRSASFDHPHGVDFCGPDHMAIANRSGAVEIYWLPELQPGAHETVLKPRLRTRGSASARLTMPGSLAVRQGGAKDWRLLACNNDHSTITVHEFSTMSLGLPNWLARLSVRHSEWLNGAPLDIPDGIAVSSDGGLIAISNHATGSALLYEAGATAPMAELGGMVCPHGLRFSPDDAWLHVADAGCPYLCSYEKPASGWQSVSAPTRRVRILPEDVFRKGHYNPLEGGIKGLDIEPANGVLALTCEEQPLAFCRLDDVLQLPLQDAGNEVLHRSGERDAAIRKSRAYWEKKRQRKAARKRKRGRAAA